MSRTHQLAKRKVSLSASCTKCLLHVVPLLWTKQQIAECWKNWEPSKDSQQAAWTAHQCLHTTRLPVWGEYPERQEVCLWSFRKQKSDLSATLKTGGKVTAKTPRFVGKPVPQKRDTKTYSQANTTFGMNKVFEIQDLQVLVELGKINIPVCHQERLSKMWPGKWQQVCPSERGIHVSKAHRSNKMNNTSNIIKPPCRIHPHLWHQ